MPIWFVWAIFQQTIYCTWIAQLDRKSDSDQILPPILFSHPCRGVPQSSFKPEVVSCNKVDVKEGLRHTPWDYIHCQQCQHLVGCHVSFFLSPVQWFRVLGLEGIQFRVWECLIWNVEWVPPPPGLGKGMFNLHDHYTWNRMGTTF